MIADQSLLRNAEPGPAAYACRPELTRGRLKPEPESPTRSVFQRDRDRIIHSGAFRKLKYKTQVFVYHEGDYYRTRLTHSLEVAQIARSVSRTLGLNEDLAEAVALAHDLGHTCFGHAGEEALNESMLHLGGFSHNDHTLRILTRLERRYADFDGLNLTWETLEGLAKHNGPLRRPPPYIAEYDARHPLELSTHASAEAQAAAIADDIAYNNHDLDDGLRAGIFTLEEIAHLPLIAEAMEDAKAHVPAGTSRARLAAEIIRRVINAMVNDVVAEAQRRIAFLEPRSADDIRAAAAPVVVFSARMTALNEETRAFLRERMYRHWRVNRTAQKTRRVLQVTFSLLHGGPDMLPPEWRAQADGPGSMRTAAVVCDYIAGMTDRFALEEHRRLTDPNMPG